MIALIVKELRYYAGQRKFRRIQLIIIGMLSLVLLISAFELFAYAQRGGQFNVGYGIYSILVIAIFIMLLCLVVPLQAIEAAQIENLNSNIDLLRISPLSTWKQLAAKLAASIIAALWSVWLVTPLFWFSIYSGGLTLNQIFTCLLVYIASISLFSMIGICFAFSANPVQARVRSFSTILLITFLPLISLWALPFDDSLLSLLNTLSPVSVLLSIVGWYPNTFMTGFSPWSWMVCVYFVASTILFWIAAKRHIGAY